MRPAYTGPRVQIPPSPPPTPSAVRSVSPSEEACAVLDRDAGVPEEPRRLRQVGGAPGDPGLPRRRRRPTQAELVVANTCAFIEAAREESIETVLDLAERKRRRRATGRDRLHGRALRRRARRGAARGRPRRGVRPRARPDRPPVSLRARRVPAFDLLNLPRPRSERPWAYVKIAEGCDRRCGFCAIPTFRGDQRSRSQSEILAESRALAAGGVKEIVLIAQDLASWGHDRRRAGRGEPVEALETGAPQPLVDLVDALRRRGRARAAPLPVPVGPHRAASSSRSWRRGVPYFDLSLQHVTRPLLRAMRRWGDGERFLERIAAIRRARARRDVPLVVHPGLPRRDRGRPGRAARVRSTRPSSTGPASSPSPPRTARRRRRWRTRSTPRWPSSGCAR